MLGISVRNLTKIFFCEGTPIYKLLSSGAERMYQYIRSAGYDNIICTHVFPALALTEMRRQHPCLQLVTSHISTDYTCAPCTADSALDWYFIPSTSLLGEFEQLWTSTSKADRQWNPCAAAILPACVTRSRKSQRRNLSCSSAYFNDVR